MRPHHLLPMPRNPQLLCADGTSYNPKFRNSVELMNLHKPYIAGTTYSTDGHLGKMSSWFVIAIDVAASCVDDHGILASIVAACESYIQ